MRNGLVAGHFQRAADRADWTNDLFGHVRILAWRINPTAASLTIQVKNYFTDVATGSITLARRRALQKSKPPQLETGV
jgi:hypothetical protein